MGNRFLYDVAKAKTVEKTRTKATGTQRIWPVNLGNNWCSNTVGHVLLKECYLGILWILLNLKCNL